MWYSSSNANVLGLRLFPIQHLFRGEISIGSRLLPVWISETEEVIEVIEGDEEGDRSGANRALVK